MKSDKAATVVKGKRMVMLPETISMKNDKGTTVVYRTVKGKRMVMLPEAEYQRLRGKADEAEPILPAPDAAGNYPALEALRVSIAQTIIRRRRKLDLSQAELARRAGIRVETLNRLEQAKHVPGIVTVEKIEAALRQAESKP